MYEHITVLILLSCMHSVLPAHTSVDSVHIARHQQTCSICWHPHAYFIFRQPPLHRGPGGVRVQLLGGGRAEITEFDHTIRVQQEILNLKKVNRNMHLVLYRTMEPPTTYKANITEILNIVDSIMYT